MKASPSTDPLTALLEDTILEGAMKEKRLERLVGDSPAWSCDLRESVLTLGGHAFRVDVLATESHRVHTLIWAWTDPSFREEHTRGALLARRAGALRDVALFLDDREIPLDRLDGDTAGMIASGVVPADAHFVAVHAEGAVVFLLHGGALAEQPFTATDLVFGLARMTTFPREFDRPRAVEAFVEQFRPPDLQTSVEDAGITFTTPGGRIHVAFDELGRVVGTEADLVAGAPFTRAGEDAPPGSDDETVTIGTLALPGGELVACDPFALVAEAQVTPLGGVVAGTHDVDVWLIDDPEGGRRVQVAYVFFRAEGDDDEVVDWQPADVVPCDSGILCFAEPGAARRLAGGDEQKLAELRSALEARSEDTWTSAALDGLVAFSPGFGAREYEVALGYNAGRRLVCASIDCLPPEDLEHDPDLPPSVAGSPGRGLQHAQLIPPSLGAPFEPGNVVLLPPAAALDLAALYRSVLRRDGDGELHLRATPEYDAHTDDLVPLRIRVGGSWGGERIDEALEVPRP